jgi:hypothetical protein
MVEMGIDQGYSSNPSLTLNLLICEIFDLFLLFCLAIGSEDLIMSTRLWVLATHPLALMAAELLHVAVMIGFTSPDSFIRLATLPFQFWIVWLGIATIGDGHQYSTLVKLLIASHVMLNPLDYIDRVLLQRWAFEIQGPVRTFSSSNKTVLGDANKGKSKASRPLALSGQGSSLASRCPSTVGTSTHLTK